MKKYLFYIMSAEKMNLVHVLLNALDLSKEGNAVKIVFEGESVKAPLSLENENNGLYKKALDEKLIAGVCLACAEIFGVKDEIEKLGLPLLEDMNGHAGILPYVKDGYEVTVW